ncbi:MAG: NAD(P)H-quinone oxidoreductase [Pseudomonadota bacterium]
MPLMQCVEIAEPGGPEVLTLAEQPRPVPTAGEILIKVEAAGVNRPDILQRRGFYPPPPGASPLPGLEVAGTVAATSNSNRWKEGQRVMALLPGGGYAAFASVDETHVMAVPDKLSFIEAAALPETLFTVWANVFEDGRLVEGETLFVHGATSGIGTMAATLSAVAGASIYGTAGTDEKCRAAEALGYKRCFNYNSEDWAAEMVRHGSADVVLDMVGGNYVAQNLTLLKPGGRHCSIAFLNGVESKVNILTVMQKRLCLTGSTLRSRAPAEKSALTNTISHHLGVAMARGQIKPVIDRTFPLLDAASAHEYLEAGQHVGKVVLTL